MANWWETTNVSQIANEFARAFKAQGVMGGESGGGTSSKTLDKTKATEKDTTATKGHTRAVIDNEAALKKFGSGLSKAFKAVPKAMDWVANALKSQTITKAADNVKSALATGAEAGTLWRREVDMMRLAVPVETLNQFSKVSRQAQIGMGGYNEWVGEVTEAQRGLFDRIGDTAKALEFSSTALERFGHSGIQPTLKMLESTTPGLGKWGKSLMSSMDDLQKLGVSYEESQQILQSVTEDEDVRNRLRAASSEKERRAIIQGQMARMREFKALGMTTEQMRAASKALEQLGGKKPLDRYKQAAKAQAALTAMGIEGADEVARTIRLGARATDEERDRMREVLGNAQDAVAEAALGGVGKEFTFATLMEKSGLEDLIGKEGPFSTKLDENVKVTDDQIAQMATVSNSVDKLETTMRDLTWGRELSLNMYNNNLAMLAVREGLNKLGDIVGTLTKTMIALQAAGGLGNLLKGKGKGILDIAKKGATSLKGPAGAVGRLGVYGAAAYGTHQAYQAITTGRSDVHDMLTSTETGMKLSDAMGEGITNVLAFFGHDASKEALESARKYEESQKKAEAEAVKKRTDEVAKIEADAAKKRAQMSEEQLKRSIEAQQRVVQQAAQQAIPGVAQSSSLQKDGNNFLGDIKKGIDSLVEISKEQVSLLNLHRTGGQPLSRAD